MSSHDYTRLGAAVRQAREARGWRQQDLADRAQVGLSSVQNVEAGRTFSRTPPSLRKIEAAIGWEDGSAMTVLRGGEPTLRQQPVSNDVHDSDKAAADASASIGSDLPLRAQVALGRGKVFDADVMQWDVGGADFSVIVIARSGAFGPEEGHPALQEQWIAWAKMKRDMQQAAEKALRDGPGADEEQPD